MPMRRFIKKTGQWGLILGYLLLVLMLQPLLLEHTFAAGTSHEHSDQDICAWLDHAASAGLHSVAPPPVLLPVLLTTPSALPIIMRSVALSLGSVRGPPSFVSYS
ncbi:MAG: hypothetical protein NNA25_01335 [Nitrospira sp.]|nr:hypothetical protein [Nitrospira sp.]